MYVDGRFVRLKAESGGAVYGPLLLFRAHGCPSELRKRHPRAVIHGSLATSDASVPKCADPPTGRRRSQR
jgi:hypothetical protein